MMLQHGLSEDSSYTINQSLRLRASASAYLSRTPASVGNRTTWTWSGWVKRGILTTTRQDFYGADNSNRIAFSTSGGAGDTLTFELYNGSGQNYFISTTAVYRDPSSWMHVVAVWDSNNTTASERMRLFVNGSRITAFTQGNSVPSGALSKFNSVTSTIIGGNPQGGFYFDGYLSEINFIDGQALDPSYFGQTDAATGIWVPKKYTGTYGTNGFYLPFNDATSLTTLGYDRSGNSNNWTCNGISITAGATYDVMKDSPTNGPNEVGNYCTWNPLVRTTNNSGSLSQSDGNLQCAIGSYGNNAPGTLFVSSGKWYWEVTPTSANAGDYIYIGVAAEGYNTSAQPTSDPLMWAYYGYNGNKINNNNISYGATYTVNSIIGVALDMDDGTITFYKNGVSQGIAFSNLTGKSVTPIFAYGVLGSLYGCGNFGQRPFAYTPPTGFKPLHTGNLSYSTPVTTSGTFTGNASTDGPCIFINGTPTAMTINGNAVTFATHADKLAGGFKVRSSSASYNAAGTNTYSITTNSGKFKYARAQANP